VAVSHHLYKLKGDFERHATVNISGFAAGFVDICGQEHVKRAAEVAVPSPQPKLFLRRVGPARNR
jgi:predicted ATPase with chaperone activity